jgi:group I intron endonuclease
MNQGIIYAIYNKETGKYYVGQTINELNKRWKEHLYEARRMNPSPLYKSLRKYGADKFNIRVIEECSSDILDERETYWISEYNSYNNGYNQTSGAGGQYRISDELKDRISDTMTGVEKTPEHIENIRKGMKRSGANFTIRGDGKHSRVKVKTINVDTLEETYYDSITECAESLDIAVSNLHRYIKHGWKVKGHRIIKLEDKKKSYAIYGVDKVTNKIKYAFPSVRAAGRELGTGGDSGCTKSLKHPHKYTWKGCYWFYQ